MHYPENYRYPECGDLRAIPIAHELFKAGHALNLIPGLAGRPASAAFDAAHDTLQFAYGDAGSYAYEQAMATDEYTESALLMHIEDFYKHIEDYDKPAPVRR
jgi:hypothetical protein